MKMNKIVASVSAAALAVSALATSALAANTYTYDAKRDVIDYYEITLKGELKAPSLADDSTDVGDYGVETLKVKLGNELTIDDLTMEGKISFTQTLNVKDTIVAAEPIVEGQGAPQTVDAEVDVTLDGYDQPKEYELKLGDISIPKKVVTSGDSPYYVKKDGTETKISAELTFQLFDFGDLVNLLGGTRNLVVDAKGNGIFKTDGMINDNDLFEKTKSKGRFQVTPGEIELNLVTGSVTPANPFTAKTAIGAAANSENWNLADIKVVTKKQYDDIKGINNTYGIYMISTFNQAALKDLANGGKMTVNLKDELGDNSQYVVRAVFENDFLKQRVESEAVYTGNSLVFDVPANFTYSPATDVYGEPCVYLNAIAKNGWTFADHAYLDTVVFEASGADVAPAETTAPTANEGDDQTNKPAETTAKPAAPAADDKNQPTGVAIAIVPAIVAAAGVIISKKRK